MFHLHSAHHPLSDASALVQRLGAELRRSGRGNVLPRLADIHPGLPAGGRWIGLRNVPIECVRGTASLTTARGRDFRPLPGRAPADWSFRWSRLLSATRDQTKLPPVQLIRAGGDYWVVDGHNRVALARQRGQLWIDADITELDLSLDIAPASTAREN